MERHCGVLFGYGWLDWVVWVQPVTWVGVLFTLTFGSSPIKGEGD